MFFCAFIKIVHYPTVRHASLDNCHLSQFVVGLSQNSQLPWFLHNPGLVSGVIAQVCPRQTLQYSVSH